MSNSLQTQLKSIDEEAQLKKKALIISHQSSIKTNIEKLDEEIKRLDSIMKPYEDRKQELLKAKENYKKDVQSICVHELIEYTNYDGHCTQRTYECSICKIGLLFANGYKIVGSVHW